jgi:hypothetical protein
MNATTHQERNRYAMMVLEFWMNQQAIEGFTTGIDSHELVGLAHDLLQHGPEGLGDKESAYLAHLQGTGVEQ